MNYPGSHLRDLRGADELAYPRGAWVRGRIIRGRAGAISAERTNLRTHAERGYEDRGRAGAISAERTNLCTHAERGCEDRRTGAVTIRSTKLFRLEIDLMKMYVGLLALLAGFFLVGDAYSQGRTRQFEMVDQFGTVTAVLDQSEDDLRIRLRSGERRQYNREPRYDSADGMFFGYTNFELNRVLRFPVSGIGVCWVADLDDRFPQFRELPQRSRPIRGGIASATPPWGFGYGYGDTFSPMPYSSPTYSSRYLPRPQSVLLDSKVVANPPLPPVRLRLLNPTKRTLQVAVVDLASPSGNRSLKIGAGLSADVEFARDNGAKRISRYQTFDATRLPDRKGSGDGNSARTSLRDCRPRMGDAVGRDRSNGKESLM